MEENSGGSVHKGANYKGNFFKHIKAKHCVCRYTHSYDSSISVKISS